MEHFTEIIGFIEASMMRLFLLSDRGLTTQHAEPALKSRVRLRASMLSPLQTQCCKIRELRRRTSVRRTLLRIGCFSPYILGQDPQKRRRRRVFKYGAVQTILARYLITNDSRRNGLPVESFRRRSQVIKARKKVSKYY